MRMLAKLIFAIGIIATGSNAQDGTAERDYSGVFDGLKIDEATRDYIKRFDLFAFAGDTSAYHGLDKKYGQPGKPVLVLNSYAGGLNDQQVVIANNHRGLRHVLKYLSSTRDLNASDIAVMGINGLVSIIPDPVQNDPKFTHEVLQDKNATCKIIRSSENSTITKTAIFVQVGDVKSMQPEQLIPVMACINWGHYFHFGFSGVRDMDMLSFAEIRETSGIVGIPKKQFFRLPRFMISGHLNGKARKEVLRELAQDFSHNGD